jgi:hypothetical protein
LVLFYHSSGGKHRQQHRVDQGNRALSCSHYLGVIGLPLNSMESGKYGFIMFHDPGATSIIDSALFIGEREIVVKLKDIYDGIWGDKEKTEIIKERPTLTQDEINKLAEEYSKLAQTFEF